MILLRLISWPYLRKHLLRSLLTTAGIVLGVGVFVGMRTANQSVLSAFHDTIDRIAGFTQLQVSAGEAGFDEDVLEKVRDIRGVRAAVPVIEASVSMGSSSVLLLGVDMLGDRSLRNYDFEDSDAAIDDPLVFLAQADSIMITKLFAEKHHLQRGSLMSMRTMAGDEAFTVRGIMKPGGLAEALGGDLAVMDIYAAQKVLGRGRKFDRVDVGLDEGVTLGQAETTIQGALGPGFQIEPPSSRGQEFEAMSRVYSIASNITSLFALFIGMFIIHNTFAIAVSQRRYEIGILRAVGASRWQIRMLFLVESAIAGLIGSLVGVFFALLIARGMAAYVSSLLEQIYGYVQRTGDITIGPTLFAGAVAMGFLTSVAAALLPAHSAASVDPIEALKKSRSQSLSQGENWTSRVVAFGCAAFSVTALLFSRVGGGFYVGYATALLAAVLLAPSLALSLARALRPLFAKLMPVEGVLATDGLTQDPRRISGTVVALMLSLALVVSLAGVARSGYQSLSDWMKISLDPDLFVTTAESITSRSFVFPASLADGLLSIDGVAQVQRVRSVRLQVKGSPVVLISIDVDHVSKRARLPAMEGNSDEMYRLTALNKGVIASENFAQLHGANLGEVLDISSPNGTLRLPVVGIVRDFSDQQGSLLVSRDLFTQYWHDDRVNVFRVYLKPGTSGVVVREQILSKYGTEQRLFVLTNKDVRDFIIRVTDQWFGLTYVQIAVAVLVAVLGIANALTVSITDRRRELGVLQAVGALRQQVRNTVWLEAVAIGIIGVVLGLVLGAVQLYYLLEVVRRDLVGSDYGYSYPYPMALALLPVISTAAFLAALGPAESAVRGSLVEALENE